MRHFLLAVLLAAPLAHAAQPTLVELFTSEGCSDCPPADALLARIAAERKDVIVLSEHVDYWNRLGWTDPFSSSASTRRQEEYAQRISPQGPYTPQMVVNGTTQFVGSDSARLHAALAAANPKPQPEMRLVAKLSQPHTLHAAILVDANPTHAHLIAVLVQNTGAQQVKRGENNGRTLRHVNIAREFHDLGEATAAQTLFHIPDSEDPAGYHVVVFLQQGAGGPILSSATS